MKKVMVMAAMMLSSIGAFAQYEAGDITIQPKVGLSMADFGGVTTSNATNVDPRTGIVIGVEGEYHANTWLGISAGLMYSQQGTKIKTTGKQIIDDVDFNGTLTKTCKMDYINIPILANFYVVKGLALKVGIQPGFNINKKMKFETSPKMVDTEVDIKNAKTFDLSFPVGISYEFHQIAFEARMNFFNATNVFKEGSEEWKNETLQFTVGYKFKL